jgi:cytochrome b pre-mRNA-processing protein 3
MRGARVARRRRRSERDAGVNDGVQIECPTLRGGAQARRGVVARLARLLHPTRRVGTVERKPRPLRPRSSQVGRARWARHALEIELESARRAERPPRLAPAVAGALTRLTVAALLVLGLVVWVWHLGAERRAIEAMPAEARAVLFADTLRVFRATCAPPQEGLLEHCQHQAAFLTNFTECQDDCRSLIAPMLRWRGR